MKKKTLSIVLLVAMVFTELFTSVNFTTFAQNYHSEDAYQQLGIIHMRNTEDDIKQYINSRIESICSTGTITPRNKANNRGLNPFIYDTSLKVVYGVPFGEFSYSEDGTMMEPSTKKRGEYMYLGYSYEGTVVTNDKFIRPTAGGWLSSKDSYKNINWIDISKAEESWNKLANNTLVRDYLITTNFKDSDYTGTPAGNPGINLNYIFNSFSTIKSKVLVLLAPTVWQRAGSVQLKYIKNNNSLGHNTLEYPAMFPDTRVTSTLVTEGAVTSYRIPSSSDSIKIKAYLAVGVSGSIVTQGSAKLLSKYTLTLGTETKEEQATGFSCTKEFSQEFSRANLSTGENIIELRGYGKVNSIFDETALSGLATKTIKIFVEPKETPYLYVNLRANPQSVVFDNKDIKSTLSVDYELKNFKDTNKIASIEVDFKDLKQETVQATLAGSSSLAVTIPKSIMDGQQTAVKTYQVEVTYNMKDGTTYTGKASVAINILRTAPVPEDDLTVRLIAPSSVKAGDDFSVYVNASYSGEDEVTYNISYLPAYLSYMGPKKRDAILWYDKAYAGTSKVVVGYASANTMQEDFKYISILEPDIDPKISVEGTLKENRKVTLVDSSSTPTHYPLTESIWSIEPVTSSGTLHEDIKYTTLSGASIDVLFKSPGEYKVTLNNKNSLGYTGTTSMIITVGEDKLPAGDLDIPSVIYREPSDWDAKLRGFISFLSPDNDLYWFNNAYYRHDSDNDGDFEEHPWVKFNSPTLNTEFTLPVSMVGKYQIKIDLYEKYGQPTINEFVEQNPVSSGNWADHRYITIIKQFEVKNVGPELSFTPSTKEKVDVIIDVNEGGYTLEQVQSRVNSVLRNRLAEASVNAKITVKEAPRMNIYDSYFIATVNPNNVNKLRIYEDVKCTNEYRLFTEVDTPPNQMNPTKSSFADMLFVGKSGIYYVVKYKENMGLAIYYIDYNSKKVTLVTESTVANYSASAPHIEKTTHPGAISQFQDGSIVWVDNSQALKRIYKWSPDTAETTVLYSSDRYIQAIEVAFDNNLYFASAEVVWVSNSMYYCYEKYITMPVYRITQAGSAYKYNRDLYDSERLVTYLQYSWHDFPSSLPADADWSYDYSVFEDQVLLNVGAAYDGSPVFYLFDNKGIRNGSKYMIVPAYYPIYLSVSNSTHIFNGFGENYSGYPSFFVGTTYWSLYYDTLATSYRCYSGTSSAPISDPPLKRYMVGTAKGLYKLTWPQQELIGNIDPGNTSSTTCYTYYPNYSGYPVTILPKSNDPTTYIPATSKSIEINEYEEGRKKFYVTVNSGANPSLANTTLMNKAVADMKAKEIQFYALGTSSTSAGLNQFVNNIEQSGGQGEYIDCTNLDNALTELGNKIISSTVSTKLHKDIYIPVQESISSELFYTDYEGDTKNNHRFLYTHDSTYFENSMGFDTNSGTYMYDFPTTFDKVGKYVVTSQAQDRPTQDSRFIEYNTWGITSTKNIYVHRLPQPVPIVRLTNNGINYTVSQSHQSYDLDHYSTPNRGIRNVSWAYRDVLSDTWIDGMLPATIPFNKNYEVKLTVMDEEYAYAERTILVPDNRPIALFELKKNPIEKSYTLQAGTDLLDRSYDLNGGGITDRLWEVSKNGVAIQSGSTPKVYYGDTGAGEYTITLTVKNSAGTWSEPYSQVLSVRDDLTPPTLSATPAQREWDSADIEVTLTATDSVQVSKIRYSWSTSKDVPTDSFQDSASATTKAVQKSEGVWYLFAQAVDTSGNASDMLVRGPYKLDKTKPKLDNTILEGSVYANGSTQWMRLGTVADVKVRALEELSGLVNTWIGIGKINKGGASHDWEGEHGNYTAEPTTTYIEVKRVEEITKDIENGVYEAGFTVEGKSEFIEPLTYNFKDSANNSTGPTETGVIMAVDGTPPTVSAVPDKRELSKLKAIATISSTDSGSGTDKIRYVYTQSQSYPEGVLWNVEYSDIVNATVEDEGVWYLHIEAFDNVGNKSYTVKGPYMVDSSGPKITFTPNQLEWTNTTPTISVSVVDNMSGVKNIRYVVNESDTEPEIYSHETSEPVTSIQLDDSGIWYIHVESEDNSGNISYSMGGPYKLDLIKPVVTLTPDTATIVGEAARNASVDVTISVTDDRSGVSEVSLKKTYTPFSEEGFGASQTTTTTISNYTAHSLTLTGMGRYTLKVTARDRAGNITVKTSTYLMVLNRAPEVTYLGTSPSFLYEGDNLKVRFHATDPDFDTILCEVVVKQGESIVATANTSISAVGESYAVVDLPVMDNIPLGDYSVHIKATDPYGMFGEADGVFSVHGLKIDGEVLHTERWNINRVNFNGYKTRNPDSPRTYPTFWSGERFILKGYPTVIESGSDVQVSSIYVDILGESYSTSMHKETDTLWSGELWSQDMIDKWGNTVPKELTFRFTCTYSNGTVKTDDVDIIIDNREKYHLINQGW